MIVRMIVGIEVEGRKGKIEVVDGVVRVWVRGRVMCKSMDYDCKNDCCC